ncbi:hypothetical protein M2152_001302 [Microbacteriaceae bacterium SG_E_30_P1]|uniref:Uncharacterized protein n=1 Tax=Antiquaquibacter oligotrophicus TaxID=2880260 RepID=A0ABT6KN01_9MICO|nr:hypothetical protein [Antiquaquibacter oligotrophicus]MDH6181120.1 hypothetical protein [Antiquaquibacter oligotrophicus]UDF13183.1 hypothetical protein LH407_13630 [Antiquaquibacter oligotrophicus]
MTESTTTDHTQQTTGISGGLQLLGLADAAACEGDVCVIPEHHSTVVVNRRLDGDAV